MVIAGQVKKIAFYCRMNHRDRDYTQFLDQIKNVLDGKYGVQGWEMELYFEVASGADPNRKKFIRLKKNIKEGKYDAVISVRASMIARDWQQFMEFMEICQKANVKVLCSVGPDKAELIYPRIRSFVSNYFGGSDNE